MIPTTIITVQFLLAADFWQQIWQQIFGHRFPPNRLLCYLSVSHPGQANIDR